jgi:hypothetical protein
MLTMSSFFENFMEHFLFETMVGLNFELVVKWRVVT